MAECPRETEKHTTIIPAIPTNSTLSPCATCYMCYMWPRGHVLYVATCYMWPRGHVLYVICVICGHTATCYMWPRVTCGHVLHVATCYMWPRVIYGHVLYVAVAPSMSNISISIRTGHYCCYYYYTITVFQITRVIHSVEINNQCIPQILIFCGN